MSSFHLVLFGPPGAGKGTQARRLALRYGLSPIATGDMMRAEREAQSELGLKVQEYLANGMLVPDQIVAAMVEKRIASRGSDKGVIFDGYPRTVPQAEGLDAFLQSRGESISLVVALNVPVEEIISRLSGRRICLNCGRVHHILSDPPKEGKCSSCGSDRLVQRDDDSEEVARRRFEEYKSKTEPVLEHYKAKNTLALVDGVGLTEVVETRIVEAIESRISI